jgi:hypothetical protein
MRLVVTVAVSILGAAACTSVPIPSAAQSPENPANGPNPPPGQALRLDHVALSDDGRAIALEFTGARPYKPDDPCSAHYFGWAHEFDGVLQMKVVDDTPPFPPMPEGFGCDAVGHGRTITVELEQPFQGGRAHDLAGVDHLLRPPEGLVDLPLPDAWTLLSESQNIDSPDLQWARIWIGGGEVGDGGRGRVQLIQTFDGSTVASGGDEVRDVEVNGNPARLFRHPPTGELLLVWRLDDDGLALVANEADFPIDQLIELAESVSRP